MFRLVHRFVHSARKLSLASESSLGWFVTEAQAEGAIEGIGDDYRMDDFFATDFKYKRFDVSEAAPRDATALTGAKRVTGTPGWFRRAGAIGDDAVVQASALD